PCPAPAIPKATSPGDPMARLPPLRTLHPSPLLRKKETAASFRTQISPPEASGIGHGRPGQPPFPHHALRRPPLAPKWRARPAPGNRASMETVVLTVHLILALLLI